jgi:hypothetical protein
VSIKILTTLPSIITADPSPYMVPMQDPYFAALDSAFGSESSTLEYSILSAILGSSTGSPLDLDLDNSGSTLDMELALPPENLSSSHTRHLFSGLDSRMSPEPYALGLLHSDLGAGPGMPGSIGEPLEGSPEPYMQGLHDAVFSPLEPLPPLELGLSVTDLDGGVGGMIGVPGMIINGDMDSIPAAYRGALSRAESPVQVLSCSPGETVSGAPSPKKGRNGCGGKSKSGAKVRTPSSLANGTGLGTATLDPSAAVLASPNAPHLSVALVDALHSGPAPPSPPEGAADVYTRVTSAFDYTTGYHALMRHLHSARFAKADLLRIVRALAVVRPSLIALQKCFQRSLLEYARLISYAGTPTVAWRRTGEVVLVGAEFAMLTGWAKEDLVDGAKYVWEVRRGVWFEY